MRKGRKERRRAALDRPRKVPMSREERARQFRAMLQADTNLTRADLARRVGVSRALVTKVLGPAGA